MSGSSFRRPIKVFRTTGKPERMSNGYLVYPEPQEITIKASVQPLRATEQDVLPENVRTCRAVKVYSSEELLQANQSNGQKADEFEWLGKRWVVVGCDAFQSGVISHYKAYAVEVKTH